MKPIKSNSIGKQPKNGSDLAFASPQEYQKDVRNVRPSEATIAQAPVQIIKEQKDFTYYPRRGTKTSYIVDGTPLTPLLLRNGDIAVNRRVQETHPNKASARERTREINDLLSNRRLVPSIQSNLSPDQNKAAEEFFIAKKLSVEQLRIAGNLMMIVNLSDHSASAIIDFFGVNKLSAVQLLNASKAFAKLKQLKIQGWDFEQLVEDAHDTGYDQNTKIPLMPKALDNFIAGKIKGDTVRGPIGKHRETKLRWLASILRLQFRNVRADLFTDKLAETWVDGKDKLKREIKQKVVSSKNGNKTENEVTKIIACDAKRPWTIPTNNRIRNMLKTVRNWFAAQGWGKPSKMKMLIESDDIIAAREKKHRVLTMDECQSILDTAYAYTPRGKAKGFYAAYFVQRLLGLSRHFDTVRLNPNSVSLEDGKIRYERGLHKRRKPKEAKCLPVYILLVSDLKKRNLFGKENLNPSQHVISTILAMAGFEYKSEDFKSLKKYMVRGRRYPYNGMRRTGLCAVYQVTESIEDTVAMGNTEKEQWENWYNRAFTKEGARKFCQCVPSYMRKEMSANDLNLLLPKGHRLDGVIDPPFRSLIERIQRIRT